MPTQHEYHTRLLPLLSDRLSLPLFTAKDDSFSIDDLAHRLAGILEELERQHLGASTHIKALVAEEAVKPWDGHGELAFLLYYLHNPPAELRAEIDDMPELKLVWDAMAEVAAPSPFTPDTVSALTAELASGGMVKCNKWGDIYGTGTYEQLDAGWAWTLKNTVMNHMPKWMGKGYGIAEFVHHDWKQPISLQADANDEVRIAIIGDWGAGKYHLSGLDNRSGPAFAVMDTLAKLETPPDYIIHLGDTYYSGTGPNRSPAGEETNNLVDALKQYPELARNGRCFTLNSNHEMYGGAYGYYQSALSDPLFGAQKGCSYFALEFGDWIIAGLDSAYFDPSSLYMEGGLGKSSEDPQYPFLKEIKDRGKKVIVMSHHTGLSADGSEPTKYLWDDVTGVLQPDYWYWGHTHLGMAYNDKSYAKTMKTRCIGHSSMPFAIPPGMEGCENVEWYSGTPLVPEKMEALYYSSPRAKNGFAMLTLSGSGITEEAYEIGNTKPVWRRQG